MSKQTPTEQLLDIITPLTVRPTSTGRNTPTAAYKCTGLGTRLYITLLHSLLLLFEIKKENKYKLRIMLIYFDQLINW